ncbi:MAG: signal recognition particle protein [Armatimonadetes bacterium]|nr:signal recognition particle protein [Armatimonadota bacterium]
MFQNLSDKLQTAFNRLRGKGKVTEQDVTEVLREVRLALLEADVNYKVVKDFVARLKERAIGAEVMENLNPGQQVVKIVFDEMMKLLGETAVPINLEGASPHVVMLVGLQGAGKTTTAGKLALHLKKRGRKPMLVAADVYRPAAVKQLEVLGSQVGVPVFSQGTDISPVQIARNSYMEAVKNRNDVLIIDTAGRLQINEELMNELQAIKASTNPVEILLVLNAMTGQAAVEVAEGFNERLDVTGFILTQLDSDARGGAALSLRAVTDRPIKFAGLGEKMDAFEPFHPDRLAGRILGMGDVLGLIEKAQETIDLKKAQELEEKLRQSKFDFEDYLSQLEQMKKMGPLDQVLSMIPGLGDKADKLKDAKIDEKQLARQEAIIRSMTLKERRNPDLLNGSRRRRIAAGSGTTVQEVNKLLNQFNQMRTMIKKFGEMEKQMQKKVKKGKGMMRMPFMR